jgi:ribosomal protein S18 acetylase RimI-like enzyme
MPRLTDKNEIRTRLRRDPAWSVYALGDLGPSMFPKTLWFVPDLTLVVQDFGTAILFAMGPGSVREALECVARPVLLQVQRDALDEVARHAAVSSPRLMWRMTWTGARVPSASEATSRLAAGDVPALQALYADGESSGESPDFFFPSMVTNGVFHGIYEGPALVAAAGTHLLAREEGAATIGNVYTRHDRRGRGLGRLVTSAVLGEIAGVETIGLNVRADNAAALHLYESLGFVRHCEFYEGLAMPRGHRDLSAKTPGRPRTSAARP